MFIGFPFALKYPRQFGWVKVCLETPGQVYHNLKHSKASSRRRFCRTPLRLRPLAAPPGSVVRFQSSDLIIEIGSETAVSLQRTWFGKRVLNNFTWFYNTHILMFVVVYAAILCHPWPGLPGFSHSHGHSVTWVRVCL